MRPGITDDVSSFTVTDADGKTVNFVFDRNGDGVHPGRSRQPAAGVFWHGAGRSPDGPDHRRDDLPRSTAGTLDGVSPAVADGVSVRIDGAAGVTASRALA